MSKKRYKSRAARTVAGAAAGGALGAGLGAGTGVAAGPAGAAAGTAVFGTGGAILGAVVANVDPKIAKDAKHALRNAGRWIDRARSDVGEAVNNVLSSIFG